MLQPHQQVIASRVRADILERNVSITVQRFALEQMDHVHLEMVLFLDTFRTLPIATLYVSAH